ncbi:long chain fatty alcohol oxidase [Pseudomassariella vexata]|uniref:Long chain fatty alcohol oxidase n=1 Tax=Pseudomassariella vexata TaxID=1141098 RepID=A0A1Y2EDR6_9PEZI|nr:long chain fatty alcohol oxidase [Pseudomassariella vexata]ORY69712.1 long chain fatty alcohol oxidase [Pseudomassariella vexata]
MGVTSHLAAPLPTPLPPLDDGGYWKDSTWQVLFALLDAAIPPIVVETALTDKKNQLKISEEEYNESYAHVREALTHPPDLDKFKEYLRARPSDNPRFLQNVRRVIATTPDSAKKKLEGALNTMTTRTGSLFFTGYCTPVQDQPLHIRQAVLQSWTKSYFGIWPILAKSIIALARKAFSQADPLYQQLIDYTDHPDSYRPGPGFDFKFMQFDNSEEPATVETDVVIVGSGCGGAVCAKVLAEAGHSVLVVDKGYYFPPSQLPMNQESGSHFLYEGNGLIQSDDTSMAILAGSCWGGGGTVNWSLSLQTQGFVRQEWANQGLPFFATAEFQRCLDRVCEYMGVSDAHIRHNHGSEVILNGSRKLGWMAKAEPQNTGGQEHYCGQCHFGCGSAEKQGPTVSWLPASAKAGAKFIEGFHASKVLFSEESGAKTAIGVEGTWLARDKDGGVSTPEANRVQRSVRIMAKKVIVSAGSLQSPLLLQRSGLKNRHIGRNLHMHPCNYVCARFHKDIKPWEGGIITSICSTFENMDGKGHGVKLETMNMVPYVMMSNFPWTSGLDFKIDALKYRNMNGYIALTRDRDSGYVFPDPVSGSPRVVYRASDFDRANAMTGVIALAKLCYIQGAEEIWAFIPGTQPFRRSKPRDVEGEKMDHGINDPSFVAWLESVEKAGNKPPITPFGSAHQMGTCRMASYEGEGVVDSHGKVWETRDLYVADASVFPSASGVNPMITNMAISDWIARGIAKELSLEKDKQ